MKIPRRTLTVAVLLITIMVIPETFHKQKGSDPEQHTAPRLVLWAWERPEDLRFVDPARFGIAFLARTVLLSGSDALVSPRVQPLYLPHKPWLMAVARIESDPENPPRLTDAQRAQTLELLGEMARLPGLSGIQIDFDAALSEREFYRDLIYDLKKEIPSTLVLSITALASWCWYDDWIRDLPVDEMTPMLFRMGPESGTIRRRLRLGEAFPVERCRDSLGISTDEMPRPVPAYGRIYIFHSRSWTPEALQPVVKELEQ
jgi:hypothetical protein